MQNFKLDLTKGISCLGSLDISVLRNIDVQSSAYFEIINAWVKDLTNNGISLSPFLHDLNSSGSSENHRYRINWCQNGDRIDVYDKLTAQFEITKISCDK